MFRKAVKKMRNRWLILAVTVFLAVSMLCAVALEAEARPVITANLRAAPANFSGQCPATIRFNGEINVQGITSPLRVQYKFIRSDGALAPIETLVFERNGSKPVSNTWTLGGAALPSYSGWQAIKILYPQELESNRAAFRVECQAEQPKKPDL